LAIASLVAVLLLCAAGLTALTMQVRCIDSAREAARLAARGDQRAAATPAPGGAAVELRRDGDYMVARVSARSPLLPGVVIVGQAVAAVEPGG
jgi:hypothetical protein